MKTYVVTATWDDEAKVWVAESDDVPGLVAEAPSKEELLDKLRVLIPELLEANSSSSPPYMPTYVHWHEETRLDLYAA